MKKISVIIPCYNEEEVIIYCYDKVKEVLSNIDMVHELIFVDDGSKDKTRELLQDISNQDEYVKSIFLSRNFGKEAAMTAGLDIATGDCIVLLDADLQDPPELIIQMVEEWKNGFDVVYAKRNKRNGETWLKKKTANMFYSFMDKIGPVKMPRNVGDCRLMSRKVVDTLKTMNEKHRFMKGLFAWVGFSSKEILYDRAPRLAGQTKWNYWKLWNFALEGITGFTVFPLKVATYIGIFTAFISIIYAFLIILKTLFLGIHVHGYASLMVAILFLGGLQLTTLGIIGEYLGRIFNETKNRPVYIIDKILQKHNKNGKNSPVKRMADIDFNKE